MAQHFEVIAMGSEPATLLTAALMARRGRQVLWLKDGLHCDRKEGSSYPAGPSYSWIPPLIEANHVARINELLGLTFDFRPLGHAAGSIGLLLPNSRIHWRGGRSEKIRSCKEMWGDEDGALEHIVARICDAQEPISRWLNEAPCIPPENFWQTATGWWHKHRERALFKPFDASTENELFSALPPHHPFRQVMCESLLFMAHVWPGASVLAAMRGMGRFLSDGNCQLTQRHEVDRALLGAMQRAGVTMPGLYVEKISTDGRRPGVYSQDGQIFTSDWLVDGLLGSAKRYMGSSSAGAPSSSSLGIKTIHLSLDAHVVPRHLATPSLSFGTTRALAPASMTADSGVMLIEHHPAGTADRIILTLSAPARRGEERRVVDAMLMRLETVVPYLDAGNAVVEHLGSSSAPTSELTTGFLWPPEQTLYAGVGGRRRVGPQPYILRAAADVVPGLGLEGAYVAAQGTVDCVAKKASWGS